MTPSSFAVNQEQLHPNRAMVCRGQRKIDRVTGAESDVQGVMRAQALNCVPRRILTPLPTRVE